MQKFLSFLIVFFSFAFLYAGWGADLCEDVTCSGHGECQEDGEDEWCVCDEGYIADGLECILGCNGVTCSGHGTCSVVSGAEVCSCEAGFHASGLNCILNEASTVDTLAILNGNDCYNTGNCHYRLIFATGAYSFTPSIASLYDIIVNVLDSENVWHNYRKTVAQCVTEGVCDNVDAQYIDFWFQHEVNGNQYITVEVLGNGDDAYDDMYHDVLIDYCYGVDCGTGGSCDDSLGYPVCSCDYGYVLRNNYCEEGWFEDGNLAAAVVELLQYEGYEIETETDIEPEMLSSIKYLSLRHKNISSLAGIGLFSSLTVLDISENHISDLSTLADCENLTVLNMSGNPASDLSPVSTLPLYSLDVSYSGVYNFNQLVSINTLYELVFADTENDKHGIIKPDDLSVGQWLGNLNLLGCNEPIVVYEYNGNTYKTHVVEIGGGCPQHGSCVNGKCECNDGYIYYPESNSCFNPGSCGYGSHPDIDSGSCVSNTGYYDCGDLPKNSEIVSDRSTLWNGSEYGIPAGRTTELCHFGDDGCDNSICQWDCRTDYFWVKDDICVSINTTKFIPPNALNQLILPNISRQDVSLEPIPGVQSFAPVLKTEIYYSGIRDERVAGWHLDLPRVELNMGNWGVIASLYEWDQETVYVHMPWGREEYSAIEKKCFDSNKEEIFPCKYSMDLSAADYVEITFYPAPGQNLFSYVVLETTGEACCKISFTDNDGKYFDGDGKGKDTWKVTRYGDDGSVTEFYRGAIPTNIIDPILPDPVPRDIALNPLEYAPRPASYRFMDYIPISKYTTRDKKVTSFKYDWERVENDKGKFSHYSIKSVDIIDPLKRVIKIESDFSENSLTGNPDFFNTSRLYKPLEGEITVSVGNVNANPFKKVAEYNFGGDFEMEAKIYKNGNIYRIDEYSIDENNADIFHLDSYFTILNQFLYLRILAGQTTWEFEKSGGYYGPHYPVGYKERKLVKDSSEYLVKTVRGEFHSSSQRTYKDYYKPYSLFFLEDENNFLSTTTIYSHEKNGSSDKKRIVENYFTNWLQPAKKVTCERNDDEKNCDGISNTVTEEIRYNVGGSPIYFKNADNQVTVNLYDTTSEVNSQNYTRHFILNPLGYSNAINLDISLLIPDLIRADNLHKFGTLACSAVYSLDADDNLIDTMLMEYISSGFDHSENWCSNASDRRVTNYEWDKEALGKPYDLQTVTYPDGKVRSLTYDYEISAGSAGKVWGETVTGSNNQNTLQTCYEYDENYQLAAQGIGAAGSCNLKKGFEFSGEGGLLMTQDYSFDENNSEVLENDYIYDYLGRKLVERNSAGVSTVYVYDSLDRVVFTFFGCNVDNFAFENRVYAPYNFDGNDLEGENGRGVPFTYTSGEFPYARYINLTTCEYYRKYKYDVMSNLVETDFFEYWGVNANNQIVKDATNPKIIKQTTVYDKIGRAIKSCQFDVAQPSDKRCIETEHDIFGNITKKTENGEVRTITYDLRNRPLTVTVDGVQTEEYSYSNSTSNGYFGYDSIANKYENIDPLITYKDKWNRAAKQTDPFGNETVTTYESNYSDNILSQITTTSSNVKTGETAWTYDDLDRKLSETRKQFIPGSESTTNVNHVTWWQYDSIGNVISVESSDGTKQSYSYDSLNRPVETINYEKINSNDVETSYSENFYDTAGRLFSTETTRNNQTITEDYGFDTFGRVIAVRTTDPENSSRYRLKFYNTGGQVIWEADEESDGTSYSYTNLDILNVEVGNEKYYTYNAFGDLKKTVYVMTNNGKGFGSPDINPWLNDSHITTNFTYDIFGRITSRINDRSGVTEYNYYTNNTTGSHRRNKLQSIQISPAPTDNDTGYQDSDSSTQTYTYTYDDKGDEASVEYEEGNYSMLVNFTRDAFGRITGKTSNGSVPVTQTFTYNNRNLLETATDTVGNAAATSVTRFYDSFGNPYSESVMSDNITKTVSRRMTDAKTYQFTYPDGKIIRKTATGSDLDSIEYGTTGNLAEIAAYSRANGVLTAVTKGQNLTETFSYNTWNQLENHTINNANADIYDMTYGYSRGWHLIEKADGIRNTSDKYSYDSYYRLKEVKYDFANNTAARTDSFFQDGVHNIEQSTENGVTYAWGVDKLNRLRDKKVGNNTESAYGYDERNNMIFEDRSGTTNDRTYIYDDLNRLIEVKDGSQNTIAEYTYDAFNRRITKAVGSTTERYSYDDWDIVEISTNSNDYTNIIDSGTDRHIAIEVTANNISTLYYFLTDERGNVTALTDANGNILERYRYRVYGDFEILDAQFTPKNCNNQTCYATDLHNFLWGGSLYEPETGLYWMRNRYYHIDMHRFINQDPIGIWGDANNLGNGFAYVAGMVIEASDPSGLELIITVNRTDEEDGVLLSEITVFSTNTGESISLYGLERNNGNAEAMLPYVYPYTSIRNEGSLGFRIEYTARNHQIHSGSFPWNSRGCILPGIRRGAATEYNNEIRSDGKKHFGDTYKKASLGSAIAMDKIKRIYREDGSEKVLVIITDNNKKFADAPAKNAFKDKEQQNKTKKGKTQKQNEVETNNLNNPSTLPGPAEGAVRTVYPNGAVVDCEFGSCWCVSGNCAGAMSGNMPSNPDEDLDSVQQHLAFNILKKMLRLEDDSNEKPFEKYESDGYIMFVRNPFYKQKDPLKTIIKDGHNGRGFMFVRNPFAAPPEYNPFVSTADFWFNSGFNRGNIDPYWQ